MQKSPILINKISRESPQRPSLNNPDNLLKNYLKLSIEGFKEPDSVQCNCIHCKQAALKLDELKSKPQINFETQSPSETKVEGTTAGTQNHDLTNSTTKTEPHNTQANNPTSNIAAISDMTAKIAKLKSSRDEFNKSENPNMDLLNPLLPYRNSIAKDPEKLKKYDELVKKITHKAKFQMSEEEFNKDTGLSDLSKLRPMDSFLANLVAGSIVELYHNREDLIDKVLDRPEGFAVIALTRKKDSGAVGLYDTKNNFIIADGAAIIMGMLNLKGGSNNTEQLDVIKHEFTHAVDAIPDSSDNTVGRTELARDKNAIPESSKKVIDEGNKSQYKADGRLPGMTKEDKKILEAALTEIQTNEGNVEGYAKTDKEEFIATTMETFTDNPLALKNGPPALKALYDMYANYLKFDPLKEIAA